ncbi:MAG: AAA family ATPase [Hungatella sp.]
MKLLELHIDGFGKFHDRTISFSDGLNVVYGKNEAGKSTLHTFIRGMLFGIEKQRGRASKNDLYHKFEPWENSGTYKGSLRVEYRQSIYRIERSFQKNNKELTVVNETLGCEVTPTKAFFEELLGGLSETSYNNTISIGQLKSATGGGMVSELKNYIANMNTSGNMALNITKATAFLKSQRKEYEARLVPEAARTYTALLGEIKTIEKEIAAPEYENQMSAYQRLRNEAKSLIDEKQQEKERLLQKVARGRQVLAQNQFTDLTSITDYENQTQDLYDEYLNIKVHCEKKSRTIGPILLVILATILLGASACFYYMGAENPLSARFGIALPVVCGGLIGSATVCYLISVIGFLTGKRYQKDLALSSQALQETFSRHLGDSAISDEAISAFDQRMVEFQRLSEVMDKSEALISHLVAEISSLAQKQTTCSEVIEKQQKVQWELEKKLELLSSYKTQADALKHTLIENDRVSEELSAIDLASETMSELSTTIRDSFGLYLNKAASDLISGITGGIYSSMSVDENLNIFMNTKTKLVPIDQVSSGTMDQVYLALRLAAAKLIQKSSEPLPLIFDDSFVLYDDERLKSALKWLSNSYPGQIIIFTCHQREAQMLTANLIPYHLIPLEESK